LQQAHRIPAAPSSHRSDLAASGIHRPWLRPLVPDTLRCTVDVLCGSIATDRCAMKIGPCPQCPESDGCPSRRRPSRWAITGPEQVQQILAPKAALRPAIKKRPRRYGLRMKKKITALVACNNTLWCDAVCRARPANVGEGRGGQTRTIF